MKNRERQRRNRRLKDERNGTEKPWLNREGYYDLTAYHGIKRAMKGTAKAVKPKNCGGTSKDRVTADASDAERATADAENPNLDGRGSIGCSQ